MILKLHTGWETWKYLDDIKDPEIEVVSEHALAFRLGYTLDRLRELEIVFPVGVNYLTLLDSLVPIDNTGSYTGQLLGVIYSLNTKDIQHTPQFESLDAPGVKQTKDNGDLMLAITCSRAGVKHHIFTNCETYLMNDQGKNINRLL